MEYKESVMFHVYVHVDEAMGVRVEGIAKE